MTRMEKQEKYLDIINEIDVCFNTIKAIRPLSAEEISYFNEEFSISASHNSNAIEGNTFTYDETRLLLKEGVTCSGRSFREHEEILGYKHGFDFLYKFLKETEKPSEQFIKKLNAMVLRGNDEAGEYRQIQNYVGNMFEVRYTPCSPTDVPIKMQQYVADLYHDMENNADIKSKVDIDWFGLFHNLARHHIEFEKIHPFIDGNGRTGRLLLTYEMLYIGLLPIDIRYEEKSRYYAAFKDYDDKRDYGNNPNKKTDKMAKLLAECELRSMRAWINTFGKN